VPGVAALVAVRVRTLARPALKAPKVPVTPVGRPVRLNVTAAEKLFWTFT
jgi:hypothetical protein